MAKASLQKYNNKFNIDVIWNLGSFVLAGLIFVIINTILLKVHGKEVVGVFNQVYAVYILLAQLAVAGIHLSVQVFIPKYAKNKRHTDEVLSASLVLTLLFSTVVAGIIYIFYWVPGYLLSSPEVVEAFQYVVWGLVFFSLNKVLLAFHNGFRRMKAFAVFQFLRISFMLGALAVFLLFTENTNYIPSLLAVAEFLLFIVLIIYSLKHFTFKFGKRVKTWVKIHFIYGMQALPGNFLLDANTRVDVIMLGLFLDDGQVGIYSFALNFAEGVMQIPVIFRNNINPIITKALGMKEHESVLSKLLKKNRTAFYKIISSLAFVSILFFPVGLMILQIEESFYEYWLVYGILVGAMVLVGGYMPFQMLFNQIGRPALHSWYVFFLFITNVIGNLILIQFYGIYGAAAGTALAILAQAVLLKVMLHSRTKYRI